VNELLRPVEQVNSKAFAIMEVPDQMPGSSLCQSLQLAEKTRELKPSDAKYGTYYLSASRLNYGQEESPALLLLWTREKEQWKVVAWAVEGAIRGSGRLRRPLRVRFVRITAAQTGRLPIAAQHGKCLLTRPLKRGKMYSWVFVDLTNRTP